MIIETNADQYHGKTISHFEEDGQKIDRIHMNESLTIVFTDETQITLSLDWRGKDCYISQVEE